MLGLAYFCPWVTDCNSGRRYAPRGWDTAALKRLEQDWTQLSRGPLGNPQPHHRLRIPIRAHAAATGCLLIPRRRAVGLWQGVELRDALTEKDSRSSASPSSAHPRARAGIPYVADASGPLCTAAQASGESPLRLEMASAAFPFVTSSRPIPTGFDRS